MLAKAFIDGVYRLGVIAATVVAMIASGATVNNTVDYEAFMEHSSTAETNESENYDKVGDINEQFHSMMDYFLENDLCEEGYDYPSFYAGAKIAKDYGKLTVYVTEISEEICKLIQTATNNESIEIVKVEHSYNELLTLQNQIYERYFDFAKEAGTPQFEIKEISTSIAQNSLIISLSGNSDENEARSWAASEFPNAAGIIFELADEDASADKVDSEQEHTPTSRLISLGDYTGLRYHVVSNEPTEEEIAEIVYDSIMFGRAEMIPVKNRTVVEENDTVVCHYTTYINGRKYSEKSDEVFDVGTGAYLDVLEKELIGREVGKLYEIEVVLPTSYPNTQIAGKNILFEIVIDSINSYKVPLLPEITSEDYALMGYESYEDYYNSIKKSMIFDRKYYRILQESDEIISQIIKASEFELSDSDIENEFAAILDENNRMAYMHNLTLEDYAASVLRTDFLDFLSDCSNVARKNIKYNLVVEKLKELIDLECGDDEIEKIASEDFQYTSGQIKENFQAIKGRIVTMLTLERLVEVSIPYTD